MNVLITSAGRRGSLVQIVRRTLDARRAGGHVFAVDARPEWSAACRLADRAWEAPRVSAEYVPFLLDLCLEHRIEVVIPTIDPELPVLAAAADDFGAVGARVAVSSVDVCRTFSRKRSTHEFLSRHGLPTPALIEDFADAPFPLFAKLDDSSSSIGARRVDDAYEAERLRSRNADYVFQPMLAGDEFTVDAFVDSNGRLRDLVPRQRLEIRGGEVSKAVTVRDPRILDEVARLFAVMHGAYGVLNVQLFRGREGGLSFVEVNPRFGGGFPLSFHAGANMVDYLLRDARGEPLEIARWRENTLMLRYDAEVIAHHHRL
ncbi:MAG TPA: ATP-grasp domain-containing protein [Gammaproteobacteria bacterium]